MMDFVGHEDKFVDCRRRENRWVALRALWMQNHQIVVPCPRRKCLFGRLQQHQVHMLPPLSGGFDIDSLSVCSFVCFSKSEELMLDMITAVAW